jgi:superfamily II DNA or RNA helicase
MIELINPSEILLTGYEERVEELKRRYSYTNSTIFHQIQRLKNNPWFVNKYGEEAWHLELSRLREKLNPCLIKETNNGLITYSGFLKEIAETYQDEFKTSYTYPEANTLPWYSPLPFKPYEYQLEALEALLRAKHGCAALAMGLGKSVLILLLLKMLGLKSVVMVPSVAIGSQLFDLFTKHLGPKNVGMYGDGKKHLNKLITVALGQSLAKMEPNTPEWAHFSTCQVLCSDEAHSDGTETFSEVCMNLLKNIPYRFFTTGSPFRNDGGDKLLNGIMGPIVAQKSFFDGVSEGYLSKPTFMIKRVESRSNYYNKDVLRMISKHWSGNQILHKEAADLANKLVGELDQQVMIMIDHISQFCLLYSYLNYGFDFACGPLTKSNKQLIPEKYRSKPLKKIIQDFNNGNTKILIGTGAISVGVDTKPVQTIINLQSGHSKVKFAQLVGRGSRKTATKNSFNYVDFIIENIESIKYHTIKRVKVYKELYDNIIYI